MDACNTSLHQRKTMEISQSCQSHIENYHTLKWSIIYDEHIDWHCTLQWWIHVRSFIMHQKLEQHQLVKSNVTFIISWWFCMVSCLNTKVGKSQDLSHGGYNISTLVPCLHLRELIELLCNFSCLQHPCIYNVFSLLEETQQPLKSCRVLLSQR
jgi:hypothetical protein